MTQQIGTLNKETESIKKKWKLHTLSNREKTSLKENEQSFRNFVEHLGVQERKER